MTVEKLTLQQALDSARETRALELGSNILNRAPLLFRQHFPGKRAVIVADLTTYKLVGERIDTELRRAGCEVEKPFVFTDPHLYAEYSFVEQLESALKAHDAIPVAVGSGAINDLAKLASHNAGRPYMCVATAASMDGYTAFGASITFRGSKQTFNCPAPVAVLADVSVIRNAPIAMTASGYADLQAKVTAGADWILADALCVEPIDPQAWSIVQGRLRESIDNPAGVRAGDEQAIFALTEGLMLGGFAMQSSKSSRPASGAEHQFSHLWDMQHHTCNGQAPSHGFKVGIGTLAVAALYEHLFAQPIERLDIDRCCANWPSRADVAESTHRLFARDDFTQKAVEETLAKHIEVPALRDQLQRVRELWPGLKVRLREQLIPFPRLKENLQMAGAPTEPEQIGISRERLRQSFVQAYHIRRRFTVLDLVTRIGGMEQSLQTLFGPSGVWPCLDNQEDPRNKLFSK